MELAWISIFAKFGPPDFFSRILSPDCFSSFQEWPRQTKPKKGQFMNFSQGHSGTKVRCVNRACFPKEKHQNFCEKMGEIHELFVLALSLVWFAAGRLLITFVGKKWPEKSSSANRGLPLPLGRGVCETKSKNGRSRPRKPLISRVFCAQRGIETMVSDHGLGRGQTMGWG